MSFLYLEQRMSLIKENYWEARFQSTLKAEMVANEELTCKIAGLETPSMLEEKLLVSKPDFSFAKSVRVVRIPYQRIGRDEEEYNVGGRTSFASEIP
ncbi:MAG: hypothetical protein P9X27_04645 [Candidatus Kaelpia aquatica]|nr:hypothetical protein [Candidatus Kaelpia aquatica]